MRWGRIGLLAAATFFPAMAGAQEALPPEDAPPQAAEEGGQSAEIIVTAQRFEQRLQDVPISISAVTDEELLARNVTDLADMQYAIPGLSSFKYGPGLEFIQIRGVATTIGRATVGTYVDEVPTTLDLQGGALDFRLLDLERVEVLRGPQATLYGEGAMGGTIRYITASPDLDEVTGNVEAEISDTKDGDWNYQANGVLNLPIVTDRLGVRLVAGYEKIGGFIDNAAAGEDDVNDADVKTIRGKLLFAPTDRLDISLLGLHQQTDQDYQNFGVDRQTDAAVPTFNFDNYELFQGILNYDLGGATLTGSAGYIDRKSSTQNDVTPFFLPTLTALFGIPPGFITQVPLTSDTQQDIRTAELRLASRGAGRFGWLLGASYRDSETILGTTTSTAPGTLPLTLLEAVQSRKSESYSVFGEVSFRPVERLTLLAGLRYYEDKQDLDSDSINFGFPTADIGEGTFDSLNPRINIQYEFSRNSMAYANAAKGFRSGGFNLTSAGGGVFEVPPAYDPDEIWTYEVGTKQQLLGDRLFLDAAVYRSDWKDVQSNAFAPGSPIIIVTNSGKVSGWGVDISVNARPTKGLTLSAAYGWNNLEYDTATADKNEGDPVDGAVRESYAASIDYRAPVSGSSEAFFRADYQHAGPSQITLRNFPVGQVIRRPSRDLVNLRAGVTFDRFEVSVFVNNLFDEDAPNIIGPFGVLLENLEQRPRVIGVNGRVTF